MSFLSTLVTLRSFPAWNGTSQVGFTLVDFFQSIKLLFFLSSAFVLVCVGSRLLSADGDGQIKCWSMTDHLVNSWESILSSSLDRDPIIALSWLHNGVKLALHVEMVRHLLHSRKATEPVKN